MYVILFFYSFSSFQLIPLIQNRNFLPLVATRNYDLIWRKAVKLNWLNFVSIFIYFLLLSVSIQNENLIIVV
jgi:hypothetical protein